MFGMQRTIRVAGCSHPRSFSSVTPAAIEMMSFPAETSFNGGSASGKTCGLMARMVTSPASKTSRLSGVQREPGSKSRKGWPSSGAGAEQISSLVETTPASTSPLPKALAITPAPMNPMIIYAPSPNFLSLV